MAQVNATWLGEVTDTTLISVVDDKIRDTRQAFHERLEKEHVTYADSSSDGLAADDGYHLSGSAKAYAQTAVPTLRPNGVILSPSDKGRLLVQETTDTSAADDLRAEMMYYHPTHGFKPPNYFSNKVFFPAGVSIGGVSITGSGFSGFLGVNDDNQIMGFTGDLELSSSHGIIPTTTSTSHLGDSDHSFETIYGDAVHGAVGNDVADEIDGLRDKALPGRCYVSRKGFIHRSEKYAEKGTIGLCTDTASLIAMNKNVPGPKIRIAVAGFALGVVDKKYPVGTALTSGPNGILTRAKVLTRLLHPERIIGIYFRDPTILWGDKPMYGMAVVKVS